MCKWQDIARHAWNCRSARKGQAPFRKDSWEGSRFPKTEMGIEEGHSVSVTAGWCAKVADDADFRFLALSGQRRRSSWSGKAYAGKAWSKAQRRHRLCDECFRLEWVGRKLD